MFDIPQIECFKDNVRETSSVLAFRVIPIGQAFKMTFLNGIPLQVNRLGLAAWRADVVYSAPRKWALVSISTSSNG